MNCALLALHSERTRDILIRKYARRARHVLQWQGKAAKQAWAMKRQQKGADYHIGKSRASDTLGYEAGPDAPACGRVERPIRLLYEDR